MKMNVAFNIGDKVNGYTITARLGLYTYTAENEKHQINFHTESGNGRNYSKVLYVYDKKLNKGYNATRYFLKFVTVVQGFSNALYQAYRKENNI